MFDEKKARRAVAFIENLKHTKGVWHGQNFELLPWQEKLISTIFGTVKDDGFRQFNTCYVEIPKKNGKCLNIHTIIPTPDGFKTMADLKVGDLVFDESGLPCHVIAKSEMDDSEPVYRMTFRDGTSIEAGENHMWDVEDIYSAPVRKIMKTKEIYKRQMQKRERGSDENEKKRSVIRIPVARPLQTPEADLPVDPYLFGYWLGNGESRACNITVRDCDVDDVIGLIPYEPVRKYHQQRGGSSKIVYKELKPILLKSFRDKKIRPEYLRASESQRWRLLQGLMDSDGCISDRKSQSIYVSTVRPLAESVRELLWTLGIKNAMTTTPSTRCGVPTGETLYQIRFTTFADQPTSGLKRKTVRVRPRTRDTRSRYHYLESIEPVEGKVMTQCIQVDSTSHCYLAGPSMVPTHNSELAAAVALYLLCGDQEWAAEVYGCAADKQQASIVFDVACAMVDQVPELKRRIKPIPSVKRLVYQPTNSFYQVLSAEAYTKHGLNVHGVIFDELHAQPNRELFDVMTKGSGDARKQPLFFLITTAGTDRNSICFEQHQKAEDILAGRKIDPTFLPVIYGAKDDDDWTDEKVWYKANPSLGYTIDIEKVRNACRSAKENPAEENIFRQLRLDQWVKQSTRWMPMDKWDACDFPVDPEELKGRDCYGGLDLSATGDITAFVLVFPPRDEDEKYMILPFGWIPEEKLKLRVHRDHVPYDVWEKTGALQTTEGEVIHYSFIEKFIDDLGKLYHIREIAFDRWGATQMTQDLEDLGFTVVPFGQGFKDMSPPTKELMTLVLEKRIAHGGQPVLRWNMDNVFVRTDPAGNIKMDKEKSTEKIDMAVATVMALDRAIRHKDDTSVYDTRGLLIL